MGRRSPRTRSLPLLLSIALALSGYAVDGRATADLQLVHAAQRVHEFGKDISCILPADTYEAPGFDQALTDKDMLPIYRDNLYPDLLHWQHQSQLRGRKFTPADLVEQLKLLIWSPYIGVIIIQNGTVYRFKPNSMLQFGRHRMSRMQRALTQLQQESLNTTSAANATASSSAFRSAPAPAADASISLPDTLFIFNTEDVPICSRLRGCKVPVFTSFKRLSRAAGFDPGVDLQGQDVLSSSASPSSSSSGSSSASSPYPDFQDQEVLLPNFNQDWGRLCFYPWSKKNSTALLRASIQVTMDANSTRYRLAQLSDRDPEASKLLDIGIVWNRNSRLNISESNMKGFLGLTNHTGWKFLINTDGHTASSRLGHLLGINSVVLREHSPWIEYYYRSLREGWDHLSFDSPEELLSLLRSARAPERDREMQRMARNAQQFAYRYLHTRAKALYVRQALLRYNRLFKGLGSFIKHLNMTGSQPRMLDLLSALSDASGVVL